jgi:hypothetical protein
MIRHTLISATVALGAMIAIGGVPVRGNLPSALASGGEKMSAASLVPGSEMLAMGAPANPHRAQMQSCIAECLKCRQVCLKSAAYCKKMGGKHAAPSHLRVLADCAEICRTSADFMRRGSEFHGDICGVNAKVCQACEKSCAQFPNDAQMKACGAECRKCASSCQTMAGMSGMKM